MALVNEHLLKLPENYLFTDITKRINSFKVTHPKTNVINLGIGDVTRPIPQVCIEAMQKAAADLYSIWREMRYENCVQGRI